MCASFWLDVNPYVQFVPLPPKEMRHKHLLCVGWRNICDLPGFCKNHQFHGIYCVTLAYELYWEEFLIHNSGWFDQICWACAIFRWIPNLQASTDSRTDKLIWVGLGTLRFLQVNISYDSYALLYSLERREIRNHTRNVNQTQVKLQHNNVL